MSHHGFKAHHGVARVGGVTLLVLTALTAPACRDRGDSVTRRTTPVVDSTLPIPPKTRRPHPPKRSWLDCGRAALGRVQAGLGRVGRIARDALLDLLARRCRIANWSAEGTIGIRAARLRIPNRVVLTFDDGPMWKPTAAVLKVLGKHRVKATFFVVGKMINSLTYRLIRRIVREGHTLANHSYHHLSSMPRDPRAAELIRAELLLGQAMVDIAMLAKSAADFRKLRLRLLAGKKARSFPDKVLERWPKIERAWHAIVRDRRRSDWSSPHPLLFVRPPGGSPFAPSFRRSHRRTYARTLRQLGAINVLWDEDSGDSDPRLSAAERVDPKRQQEAIIKGAKKGGVFLMHDRVDPDALDKALLKLKTSKKVTITSLPDFTLRWFWCDAKTVSAVIRIHHVLK